MCCDGCGDIVHGKFKAAFISKDFITFKGQMGLNIAQTRTQLKDHIYLTPKHDGPPPELVFCRKPGLPCFEQFVEKKKAFVDSIRVKDLREETNKTFGRPGQRESDFVIGGKKNY